ncbi:MAG: flagellin lysine-N-methylase [Clostridia bacterium]|nr:flagellin lysine-N-methylase [Clostridia bacterium]
MKFIVPGYYKNFSCIASSCRHSCCIGWEIDIDADTYSYYGTIDGELGDRLKKNIAVSGGQPHFILDENERCPFLNENGLCDIIIQCGEESLCDICADHPRFRNFFSDRTEIGLGLCCEAAAELIINCDEPFKLEILDDDGFDDETDEDEKEILELRNFALEVASDSKHSFEDRVNRLCKIFDIESDDTSPAVWADRLSSLERLEPEWDNCLAFIGSRTELEGSLINEKAAGNLLCYFIYRHLSAACDREDMRSRAAFAVLSCRVIFTLSLFISTEEAARMYSCEIEYSDENLNEVLNLLCD